MSAKSVTVLLCSALTVIFLLVFFLSPSPPVFSKTETVVGQVQGLSPARSRFHTNEAPVSVKLSDGTVIYMKVPTRKKIIIGEMINIDVLTAEGEKPRYRLAQDPIQP